MQLVKPVPAFRAICLACGKVMDSAGEAFYADLDGPAYKAYYCGLDATRLTHSFEVGMAGDPKC